MSHELDTETGADPSSAAINSINNSPMLLAPTWESNTEQLPSTNSTMNNSSPQQKPSWRDTSQNGEDENTIMIEEEVDSPPPPPVKNKSWLKKDSYEHMDTNKPNNPDNNDSFNTAADERQSKGNERTNNNNNNMGTKPKLTNMSLLSSAVAHATLERCLLGVNGGGDMTPTTTTAPTEPNDSTSSTNDTDVAVVVDFSKQCKPGHVIDILELRRLSSRGVPDEPPEVRARSASAPAGPYEADKHTQHHHQHVPPPSPGGGGGLTKPHRSYRSLVWRVLLGYLPPQTSLWNDVLQRDRQLYDTLVQELFSSTCPKPHDVYSEEELERMQQMGVVVRLEGNMVCKKKKKVVEKDVGDENLFTIDDDQDEVGAEGGGITAQPSSESTTNEEEGEAPPPPPASTPLTPGLLSARMQQEWVRGEDGHDSIYTHTTNEDGVTSPRSNKARLSPMCAMNTPRTRIRREKFVARNSSSEDGEDGMIVEEKREGVENIGGDDGGCTMNVNSLADQLEESLLLPNDDDDEDGEKEGGDNNNSEDDEMGGMDTIDVGHDDNDNQEKRTVANSSEDEKGDTDITKPTATSQEEFPDGKLTQSISISKTTSSEEDCEGVELFRQSSIDDDANAIAPISSPDRMPITDEEENILLLDEIRKDVIRTHPDLRFFLEPNEDLGQKRYAALERILFVWAKLNKGVRYVQGMNEIVGTLYFVLAQDSNEDWAMEAEADTYFLFNSLMVEMRDVFVPDLDDADTGIHGRISNMITLLSLHDPEVRCHLDSVGIDPSFYSVRWLTTLLSREFLLPDTIRLWDSMFASTHKDNFLRYVSVTMVMVIRDQLLSGDFSDCLRLLQAYPPTNLDRLLESSRALWIYESQITLACHKGGISLGHALRMISPPPAIVMAYGLHCGVAPPIREQVRQVGERGMRVARGAASGASNVASAGRSFFGNAVSFWRSGSDSSGNKDAPRRSKSTM